jgi:hypothetical protein
MECSVRYTIVVVAGIYVMDVQYTLPSLSPSQRSTTVVHYQLAEDQSDHEFGFVSRVHT